MLLRPKNKVIITCAVTGSLHTPSMSPYLPITPADIANQAIEAARAGAAILHLHARNAVDGRPTPDPTAFMEFLPQIHDQTDAVINITTGGSMGMSIEERLAAPFRIAPEMCSLNMGSINFAMHGMAEKIKTWLHPWEEGFIRGSKGNIFRNSFADIEKILHELGDAYDTRFECECYDVSHLYNLAYFADRGAIKPPFFIQTIFGVLGGIGGDAECVGFMRETARRLFGDSMLWSVLGGGRLQMPLATYAVTNGGNVRVGLEDSLMLERGRLAHSNAEQVLKVRRLIEELGFEPATPTEVRQILQLKGKDTLQLH
jgi:uncharacterized protein (DUF849 family)